MSRGQSRSQRPTRRFWHALLFGALGLGSALCSVGAAQETPLDPAAPPSHGRDANPNRAAPTPFESELEPDLESDTEPDPAALTRLPLAPSVWLEGGLAYASGAAGLDPGPRFGVRGVQPLSEITGIYAAFGLRDGLTLDAGGWFSFLPGPEDLFGFRSFVGAGLSFAEGSLGLALSAAVAYEVAAGTDLVLVYTHRPLFVPELGQAFDVSLGVRFGVPEPQAEDTGRRGRRSPSVTSSANRAR